VQATLQLRVQRYGWDRAAAHYDAGWRQALAPATEALLAQAALQPGERVLDAACGSGVLTVAALRAVGTRGEVVASDLSAQMLAIAAQRAAAEALPPPRCVRADAQVLDQVLGEGGFDVALCGLGLMYMPEPEQALAALHRCLRPGGRLLVSVWGERRDCAWAEIFPIVDRRVRSEVCPLFFRLGVDQALASALQAAGFEAVTSRRLGTTLRYAGARAACDAALVGGPVALAYARFDRRTREAVQAEYLGSIARWLDGTSYRLPGSFVIASGVRAEVRAITHSPCHCKETQP
jgi:ubiquinone/menaquinone biosynthesis C-methylase UbiE